MDAVRIGKGTLSTTLADIDTVAVPNGEVRYVKALTLCNKSTESCHSTITFAGTNMIYQYILAAPGGENTITLPFFDQVMSSGERIQGMAEAASSIDFYISGREVDVS